MGRCEQMTTAPDTAIGAAAVEPGEHLGLGAPRHHAEAADVDGEQGPGAEPTVDVTQPSMPRRTTRRPHVAVELPPAADAESQRLDPASVLRRPTT